MNKSLMFFLIAKNLNADIFEIIPEEVYTSNDLNWKEKQ